MQSHQSGSLLTSQAWLKGAEPTLDAVNRIAAAKKPDTVWPIGSAKSVCAFSFATVHYVRLLSVKGALAREFYHADALRGGTRSSAFSLNHPALCLALDVRR